MSSMWSTAEHERIMRRYWFSGYGGTQVQRHRAPNVCARSDARCADGVCQSGWAK